ncbi:MAG TPA: hypothetical protein VD997_01250 [Phycisphaerales bacterium]|nr:hypothetical protein [Phycisphaerales bacterium]
MIPSGEDFETGLRALFTAAEAAGLPSIDVESCDLHTKLGGYPGRGHRMANCCRVMRKLMNAAHGDTKVSPGELKRDTAHLIIRYKLPRPTVC